MSSTSPGVVLRLLPLVALLMVSLSCTEVEPYNYAGAIDAGVGRGGQVTFPDGDPLNDGGVDRDAEQATDSTMGEPSSGDIVGSTDGGPEPAPADTDRGRSADAAPGPGDGRQNGSDEDATGPQDQTGCAVACAAACEADELCVHGFCVGQGAVSITLSWLSRHDLDLIVTAPDGTELSANNPNPPNGGVFDLDSHAGCINNDVTGVESVHWGGTVQAGEYSIRIENVSGCGDTWGGYDLRIQNRGAIEVLNGSIGPVGSSLIIYEFDVSAQPTYLEPPSCWPACDDGLCANSEPCETCPVDCGPCSPEGAQCCDFITCANHLFECAPESCACEPSVSGLCTADSEKCEPGLDQPEPFLCVDYGGADGICRVKCEGPAIGEADPCVGFEFVCGALPGEDGYCLPQSCSGYFQNDCGPDATCLPLLETFDLAATCVPDGPLTFGAECLLNRDCNHDLLCVDGNCRSANCQTGDNSPAPCATGTECMPWLVDGEPLATGSCANACEAFSLDGCPTGQWCIPIDNEPKPGPIDGYCGAASGSGVLGTDCGANASICGEDLQCVQSPDSEEPVCEQLCDPTALSDTKGDCPSGRACSPSFVVDALGEISTLLDWGTCVPGCTPWVTLSQSGCSNGNWCLPMLFNAQAGECKGDLGTLDEYDACTEASACGVGMLCLGVSNAVDGLMGVCRRLCDPEANANEAGATCGQDAYCDLVESEAFSGYTVTLDVGICTPQG